MMQGVCVARNIANATVVLEKHDLSFRLRELTTTSTLRSERSLQHVACFVSIVKYRFSSSSVDIAKHAIQACKKLSYCHSCQPLANRLLNTSLEVSGPILGRHVSSLLAAATVFWPLPMASRMTAS